MRKIDETVLRETKYIGAVVLILSILMQAVFLILRFWNMTVLWGNLLSGVFAVLNFFLMGITVQKAVTKDEKGAADMMRFSQSMRNGMLLIVGVVGVSVSCFHPAAVLIPLFFPRIAVMLRPKFGGFGKKN